MARYPSQSSGGSRPSPKGVGGGGGGRLTMNGEFCGDNSERSKNMSYFRKNKGERGPRAPPLDPPLNRATIEQQCP